MLIHKFCFKSFIKDESVAASITFFTPGEDDIVGYTCSELIAMHEAEDQQFIPSQIFDTEGHKNIFQIRFNQGGDTTSFILDKVFNKKKSNEILDTSTETIEGKPVLLYKHSTLKIQYTNTNLKCRLKKQDHPHPLSP